MTSRRRLASFTFSPNRGTDNNDHGSELERKLELLEARFTMPLQFQLKSHQNNSNNSNSPATLDAENSSPVSVQSSTMHAQSNQHRNNDSQQSFAFDTPSLLNTGLIEPNHNHSKANNNADHVPHRWEEVTSAHVARVQQMQESHDDSQQNTRQTSHVKTEHRHPTAGGSNEAPHSSNVPFVASPAVKNKNLSKNLTQPQRTLTQGEHKRKSNFPTKRPQPSIKDSVPAIETVADPESALTNASKRTRLNFDAAPLPKISSNHAVGIDDAVPSAQSVSRSPTRVSIGTKSNSPRRHVSHNKTIDKHVVDRELVTSNSRDPVNTTSHRANMTKALAAITNNAKISDFFSISNKKRAAAKNSLVGETADGEGSNENTVPASSETVANESTLEALANRASNSSSGQLSLDSPSTELELLKRKYEELHQICQDKEEQLKAVSNNKTILHTALQAALRQREQELDKLQQSTEKNNAKYRDALEELIRTEARQEAQELREKLASDGARLGRITSIPTVSQKGPPRMLMHHRSTMESWEDGYATKELQQKMKELQAKKVILEARQAEAKIAEEKHCSTKMPNGSSLAGGSTPLSTLDVREAVESVRYHLNNVRQQERELAQAEQALNDEKGAHIRALKRVASEDASRFRTRPKLNDRYVLRSLLGKGGFSEVWLAFDLIELREVAVKIHQLDSRWPDAKKDNYTKHVSREYEIHRSVRHPRIVSLFDVFEIDNNSFATVLELCEGTDLDTVLKVKRRLPERDARAILLQILSGMNYLSHPSEDGGRQGIIHYDLKPGNVLFDQYGDAKITDFGLSKIVDAHDPAESMELTSQGAGTYWYLPPECFVLEDNVRISNKVDVWSIGVIFYQMLFGKRPFGDGQSQDKMLATGTMLNAHTVMFPDRPEVSVSCKAFIEACLTYDQRFRPSIAQICEHQYVVSRDIF